MGKKILLLSASPRKGGNSDTLCDQFIKGLKSWDIKRRGFTLLTRGLTLASVVMPVKKMAVRVFTRMIWLKSTKK